ncbi:zinc ribbon domain-containing protein [Pedococcus badiiscoriae]|uniref:zinc ribbon domain-containing protein n=1 Tax=Pedococcus badiiscoriae TaxID=642776 RepID=UPI003B51F610
MDTRLDQLEHARKTLPEHAVLADLQTKAAGLDSLLVRARTELGDIQREVAKAEADVQLVRDRAARDQARLDSGAGSAKDLQAIQHELASLVRRQSELEDVEIEVMERAEDAESAVAQLEVEHTTLAAQLTAATEARDAALADLELEATKVAAPRADIVAGVGEDLVALYEKIRVQSGGLAAAALRQRRCGGCQLELNNVDMNRIKAAPADELLRCEECRRILVRTAESGL